MANVNDRNDPNLSGTRATSSGGDWTTEEGFWRDNYSTRPYATADRTFDYYRPGYQFGYESAQRYQGKQWSDVESDLSQDWDKYDKRGDKGSTWENIKASVRDAWDRVTGGGDDDRGTTSAAKPGSLEDATRKADDISRRSSGGSSGSVM